MPLVTSSPYTLARTADRRARARAMVKELALHFTAQISPDEPTGNVYGKVAGCIQQAIATLNASYSTSLAAHWERIREEIELYEAALEIALAEVEAPWEKKPL